MQMFQTIPRTMPRHGHLLVACGRCGHRRHYDYTSAARTFGPDATPPDVRRRLVCSKCGERKVFKVGFA